MSNSAGHCICPSPRWRDDPDFVCEWCEQQRENLDFEAALEATLRPCDPDEDLPPTWNTDHDLK